MTYQMSLTFNSACYFHIAATTDVTVEHKFSAVTWRTVHQHIVADAFHSKKRSSELLVHEQQASLK